jgi:hypothetical protein
MYRHEQILLNLSLYLMPVHSTTSAANNNRPLSQSHLKTWFLPLKKQFWAACVYFLWTINICFGDLLIQANESESEEDNDNNKEEEK